VLGGTGAAVAAKLGVITQVMLALKQAILLLLVGLLAIGELARRLFRRGPRAATAAADQINDATAAAEIADNAASEGADTEELAAVDPIAFDDQAEAAAASPTGTADKLKTRALEHRLSV
jgi:hypothetical protein